MTSTIQTSHFPSGPPLAGATLLVFAVAAGFATQATAQLEPAQQPLFSLQNVPGSLVLTPSVEWPTINSVANLGPYSESEGYSGYFDSNKCYRYAYHDNEAERHFYPVSVTSNRRCTSSNAPWSGNFLNWAATQTVDPFRSALTGGYRVRDTATETWLEKARHSGQGGTNIYPNRRLPGGGSNSSVMQGATPFNAYGWMRMRIEGLGNKMRFRLQNNDVNHDVTDFDPTSSVSGDQAYEVSIRVRVCVSGMLEENCRQYENGWKPEGTLQQYSDRIRYSLFGYVNDHHRRRDGGVMRAKQKYIGPMKPDGDGGMVTNPRAEWDEQTGVIIRNPDSDWASQTGAGIQDSGILNYLNKFGQMTSRPHKSTDPVSELYYAGLRYLKNQGNVSTYSSLDSMQDGHWSAYEVADGFPVITDWDDPVDHWCQPNTILGIGDIYTHRDKNLPGSSCSNDEPPTPTAVSGDSTVNVVTETNRVGQMEGVTNIGSTCNFTDRENSAYMAGLAWHANAHDIRPDLDGGRTGASTYWVDVLEAQSLEGMARNQFALAAKYGGARLPQDFDADEWGSTPLPEDWWHRNNETLIPFGSRGSGQASFKRPDNFFTAGEANSMVESLQRAFEAISLELSGTSTSAAASSAILKADTLLFTAGFRSEDWSGTLTGRPLDNDGKVADPGCAECWDAETALANQAAGDKRRIFTRTAEEGQASGTGGGTEFRWNNLHDDQQEALDHDSGGDQDSRGNDRVAWLRGQDQEGLRSRVGSGAPRLLGDIVNSDPVFIDSVLYVGANDGMLHAFDGETGEELFAYIPSKLLLPEDGKDSAPLSHLTELDYNQNHRYFVDGKLAVREVHDGNDVRTILVGSLGAGGRQVFALDVSDPTNFSTSDVLWEFSHNEMGTSIGSPQIARTRPDGDWAVFFGNGYNSTSHESRLFVVDLLEGDLMAEISTNEGDADTPNGLATPFVTDWPGGGFRADRAYAGDLHGNLWVFDLSHSKTNKWSARLLARATDPDNGDPQPITTRPVGQILDQERAMVAFGTGSYLFEPDAEDFQVQSLYGVVDTKSPPEQQAVRSDLHTQRIEYQDTEQTTNGPREVRVISDDPVDLTEDRGWILDLDQDEGERVISGPETLGREEQRVRFSTLIPDDDPCGSGRRGFFMDFDLRTGGQLQQPVFDLDGDKGFGGSDRVDVNGEQKAPSGIGHGTGERIITIRVPPPPPEDPPENCENDDCGPPPPPRQLSCDGEGNCEIVRDGDYLLGRMNWQQLR